MLIYNFSQNGPVLDMSTTAHPLVAPNQAMLDDGREWWGEEKYDSMIIGARAEWTSKHRVHLSRVARVRTVHDGACKILEHDDNVDIRSSAEQIAAQHTGDTIVTLMQEPIASIAADCGMVAMVGKNWRALMHVSAWSLHNGVFEQFRDTMSDARISIDDARAYVGPVLEKEHYEVDPGYDPVESFRNCDTAEDRQGKVMLDLNKAIKFKMRNVLEVYDEKITWWNGPGTWEDPRLFSHRQSRGGPRGHQYYLLHS